VKLVVADPPVRVGHPMWTGSAAR